MYLITSKYGAIFRIFLNVTASTFREKDNDGCKELKCIKYIKIHKLTISHMNKYKFKNELYKT